MGNSPSGPISVANLLEAVSERPEAQSNGEVEESTAKDILAKHSIQIGEASAPDVAVCVALVQSSGFWSKNYTLSPNQGRVKNWLWVHSKYRDQANALLELDDIGKVKTLFDKLQGKIKAHSDFEDTQLFAFFENNIPTSTSSIASLKQEHADDMKADAVEIAIKDGTLDNVHSALKEFSQELNEHLAREEDAILPLWLGLSEDQYQALRAGMSWKYRVMYG